MSDLRFVDLFAGIGGFHQALGPEGLGLKCVFASEIDDDAADVYETNHGLRPAGDIRPLTEGEAVAVPEHDVLAAGFPCQPFSKSGFQRGMSETRGTLFFNICQVLKARRPQYVILENVRNLAGPRQTATWETILRSLRGLGYAVSSTPAVFSPHLLPPNLGGRPQVRDRVFILAEYVGNGASEIDPKPLLDRKPIGSWDPDRWNLAEDLPIDCLDERDRARYELSDRQVRWIDTWNELVTELDTPRLPTFPIWADSLRPVLRIPHGTPDWKANFIRRNHQFFLENQAVIQTWLSRHDYLSDFPLSRRKLEWQAGVNVRDLWSHVLHLRPSGIRVKAGTYLPSLVAMNQTSIIGPHRRRITPREAARMQGLPETFRLHANDAVAYRQLGNAVNVGVVQFAFRALLDSSAGRVTQRPGVERSAVA